VLTINIHHIRVNMIHSLGSMNIGKTIISRNQAKTVTQATAPLKSDDTCDKEDETDQPGSGLCST
jgi:hypothetical protein